MNFSKKDISKDLETENKWPWNMSMHDLGINKQSGDDWPKITIVTPSYNQGEFIEETIRSILLQNYPNLEYIIIDGGSTDQTLDIIKKYERWIDHWVSEPDQGQSDAINKGFKMATGIYGNWINSDDLLAENALINFSKHLTEDQKTIYLGKCVQTDRHLEIQSIAESTIRTIEDLIDLKNYWVKHSISQQNVLFSIDEYREVGGLNINNHYSMDYELWGNLLLNGNKIKSLDFEAGIFRRYEGQKISNKMKAASSLIKSAHKLVMRNNKWSLSEKLKYTIELLHYRYLFTKKLLSIRSRLKNRFKQLK